MTCALRQLIGSAMGEVMRDRKIEERKKKMNGIAAIAAERRRQIEVEGWTPEHDDRHVEGQLAGAASAYAMSAAATIQTGKPGVIANPPPFFMFEADMWKPGSARQDLIRAGALIAAEIDRLDRIEHA